MAPHAHLTPKYRNVSPLSWALCVRVIQSPFWDGRRWRGRRAPWVRERVFRARVCRGGGGGPGSPGVGARVHVVKMIKWKALCYQV